MLIEWFFVKSSKTGRHHLYDLSFIHVSKLLLTGFNLALKWEFMFQSRLRILLRCSVNVLDRNRISTICLKIQREKI